LEKRLKVIWTRSAEKSLKHIYDFYAEKSEIAALKIIEEIIECAESITFYAQYQHDEICTKYRRMIVRHYKLIYQTNKTTVTIFEVFDSRQDPGKMMYLAEPKV